MPRSQDAAHIVLIGTVGVGKSTVARALSAAMVERSIPHGAIEFDEMGQCFLPDLGQPDGIFQLRLRNLLAVDAGLRAAGASCVIVSAAPRTSVRLAQMLAGLASPSPFVIALRATSREVGRRIRERHSDRPFQPYDDVAASREPERLRLQPVDVELDVTAMGPERAAREIIDLWFTDRDRSRR